MSSIESFLIHMLMKKHINYVDNLNNKFIFSYTCYNRYYVTGCNNYVVVYLLKHK